MTSFENHEIQPLPRPSILRANLWYLLAAAGLMILPLLASLIIDHAPFAIDREKFSSALSAVYEIGILALPILFYALRSRSERKTLRFNKPDVRLLFFAAGLAAAGVFMANYITTWWILLIEKLGGTPQASGVSIPTDGASLLVSIVLVGIVPGVCEETLFRSGLMSAWEGFGKKTALIVTSVLFALLHGTVAGLPNQIIMGAILGYIVMMSDSVYTGMVYHAVHNSLTMLLVYAANSADDVTNAAADMENINAAMGGATGYASLLFITAASIAIFTLILMAMRESAQKRGKNISLADSPENTVLSPAPRFVHFLPLIAALLTIALNYAADFAATFG